jgi:hypothetical protein
MTVYELKTLPIDTLVRLHNMAGGNRIYCMDDDNDFSHVNDVVSEHLRVKRNSALWEFDSVMPYVVIEHGDVVSYNEKAIRNYVDYDRIIEYILYS